MEDNEVNISVGYSRDTGKKYIYISNMTCRDYKIIINTLKDVIVNKEAAKLLMKEI
jgi:hypothetical protein